MEFVTVTNLGGIKERAMFAKALNSKNEQLKFMYNEILDALKRYEAREGYMQIDEHKHVLSSNYVTKST